MLFSTTKAFTLGEIIITLTIIGVIAAMTIPDMTQNIQDSLLRITWKKTFADLAQTAIRVSIDNGGNLSGFFLIMIHSEVDSCHI